MDLLGILAALALLMWFAYRGWSILLLAPAMALAAAAFSGEPLLAHWTQTFMPSAAKFLAQFFPLFLLGALFGKLMEDSGSVQAIALAMNKRLGPRRAILAVVLAGAVVTYGGVSLFVAFFVLAPMADQLFRAADIPRRLMPAAIALGTSTFTMSALPGTPAIQNAIPMPFFGTTPFAAPGLGVIASLIMLGFGLWWLRRAEAAAHAAGERYRVGTVGFGGQSRRRRVRARARRRRARVRPRRDPSRTPQRDRSAGRPGDPAARGRGQRQPRDVSRDPAADGPGVPGARTMGRYLARLRCGRVVGGGCAGGGGGNGHRCQLVPAAGIAREHGRRRQRVGAAGPGRSEPRRVRRGRSRRCPGSSWCAIGCCRSEAARSFPSPSPPTCSRL